MGLDSLFKPKGKLLLQCRDKTFPGEAVPVEIRVIPEEEIQAREARLELAGEETYYVKESHTDSRGHIQTRTVQRTREFARFVQTLAENPSLYNGSDQKWGYVLQLPADMPPTCRGKLVNIRWTLKGVLDVPKKGDLSQEKNLDVFSYMQSGEVAFAPASKSFGEVGLSLMVPPATLAGQPVRGQLTLNIKENLGIRGIRVELVQAEEAGERSSEEVVSRVQVSGESSFKPGESPVFDFSIDVPVSAPPTAVAGRSRLWWKVRAVLDRKMKTDFNVEQVVAVYNGIKGEK